MSRETAVKVQTGAQQEVIDSAVAVIDGFMRGIFDRELISTGEAADLLLDVRTTLVPSVAVADQVEVFEAQA